MKTFMPETVQRYLEERFEVSYSPLDRQLTQAEIWEYATDAEAIFTDGLHARFDAAMLEGMTIRLIVHTSGSVGSLVNQEVFDKGIRVISGKSSVEIAQCMRSRTRYIIRKNRNRKERSI